MNPAYITFALYLMFMIGVGIYFFKKSENVETYLLGGRSMGSWVTAFSAQASDMSGWLLMGLPGAVFMLGLGQIWIAIGLAIGTLLNWIIVAPRLRVFTESTKSLTLSSFFARRFHDPTNLLQVGSALFTLIFFTVYAAAGLVGAGKLFESMFNMNYSLAVVIGCSVMIIYTLMGGFLAVCWTDLFQGVLMFFAITILPIVAYVKIDSGAFELACQTKNISMALIPTSEQGLGMALLGVISTMAWGLGYFGQPHILARFMSIKSVKKLPHATVIAMVWVLITLTFAVLVGLLAIPMFGDLSKSDSEKVFIFMISELFHPYIGGVLLAAILAAIMSTIDSQLLTSSSTLVEDFYKAFLRPKASEKERLHASRFFVLIIAVVAGGIALNPSKTIFELVTFAWGGMGAIFGPVVLVALYSRRTSWQAAFCGMVVAMTVLLLWLYLGWNSYMYEIVPGFIANIAVIAIFNTFIKPSTAAIHEFDSATEELKKQLSAK